MGSSLEFTESIFDKFSRDNKRIPKRLQKVMDCYAGLELKYGLIKIRFGGGHVSHIMGNILGSLRSIIDKGAFYYFENGCLVEEKNPSVVKSEIERRLTDSHTYLDLIRQVPEFRMKECGGMNTIGFFTDIKDCGNEGLIYNKYSAVSNYVAGAVERILRGEF